MTPTGTVEQRDGQHVLVQTRQFRAPIEDVWLLDLDLTHADGVMTLTLSQPGVTAQQAGEVGPGWEYYLDRLVDAENGVDPAGRDFERDYYPAMADYYCDQF